ncbi:glycosyltransferase family 4 protein [Phenylobacterium sp.]|uniref:glycosyltransferase family 4 protein n=1 Tax=Phenylobacterium sp. TaxID=1871053 RepID=UPI0019C3F958|nr:glycosyltransferase family 4 protein [Phenylobacterium sp.]MBC7166780.1 glycosyltransferase family 4 protein [Phenylobacterium sp.]
MSAPAPTLLIVTRHYAPQPTGSAPPKQEMAEWFAANGFATEVVTVRPNYPGERIFPGYERGQHDQAVEAGVQVRRFPTAPVRGGGLLARMGPELAFMFRLVAARIAGRLSARPALISLSPSIFTVFGALPLKAGGGRHVAVVHDIQSGLGSALGGGLTRALMPILRALERWTLNRPDAIIVLSEEMKRHLRAMGVRRPIEIQPPMVNAQFIRPAQEPGGVPTLMYSGNLGRKQGLGQVLDLAAELKRRGSPARIIVRGGGAMRDELIAEAAERRLDNLDIQDLVPRDQIGRSLAEAHLHLVPQIASGGDFAVPSKIFSIMAAGRTFVATAQPGSTLAQLAAETGAFVCAPPDDAAAFADAVETLLADPAQRQRAATAGRTYVEAHADTSVVMAKLSMLLHRPQAGAEQGPIHVNH